MLRIYLPFSWGYTVLELVEHMEDMELGTGHIFNAEST
jgi:hypothetical protein